MIMSAARARFLPAGLLASATLVMTSVFLVPSAAADVTVVDAAELVSALEDSDSGDITLGADITLPDAVMVSGGHVLDLNGHELTSASIRLIGNTFTIKDSTDDGNPATTEGSLIATAAVGSDRGGIEVIEWATLVIDSGTIQATGRSGGSGIGGQGVGTRMATVIINGGSVTANGGRGAAGIGGQNNTNGGTVTINGGVVTATGGVGAAGIGAGATNQAGGTTTINGGVVTAVGGTNAAGIGGSGTGALIAPPTEISLNGGGITASSDADVGIGFASGIRPYSLHVGDGAVLTVPDPNVVRVTGGPTVEGGVTLTGEGLAQGSGTITNWGAITAQTVGDGWTVTENNFLVTFDATNTPANTSEEVRVYARYFERGAREIPAPPEVPGISYVWRLANGDEFTSTTLLNNDTTVFAELESVTVDSIQLVADSPGSTVAGTDATFTAVALDDEGEPISGVTGFAFSSSEPDDELIPSADGMSVTLRGPGAGDRTLTAELLIGGVEFESELDVSVSESSPADGDGDAGEADTNGTDPSDGNDPDTGPTDTNGTDPSNGNDPDTGPTDTNGTDPSDGVAATNAGNNDNIEHLGDPILAGTGVSDASLSGAALGLLLLAVGSICIVVAGCRRMSQMD